MVLDGITILFDTSLLSVTVGALLVFAGTRRNGDRALTIWGAGYLIAAAGVILIALRSRLPDFCTIDVANAALILGYGIFLTGARSFAGRRTPLWQVVAGAAIWLLACRIPAFYGTPAARVVVFSLTISAYVGATCMALWRVKEALPSRVPLIAVLALHGFAFLVRAPGALLFPPTGVNVVVTPWFVAIAIESLFHLVASSLLLVTMSKERSENGVQHLARTDPLTGLRNRRSFLESGARRLARSLREAAPVCVLMIDIDHFKEINDRRGHDAGDEVLQSVAAALTRRLRPDDLCGRLGGEEFGCLLMDCDSAQGREVAERLRNSIQTELDGLTVSVGVACTTDAPSAIDLRRMLVAADRALYASKDDGRNRVTLATAA